MDNQELVNKDFEGDIQPSERLHIKLQAAGNAPILKKSKIGLKAGDKISKVAAWLRLSL